MVQFRRRYGIIPSQAMPSKSRFGAAVAGVPNRWSPPFRCRSETPFSGVVVGLLATLLSALLGIGVEDVVLASSPISDVVCQRHAAANVAPLPTSCHCRHRLRIALAPLMTRLQGTLGRLGLHWIIIYISIVQIFVGGIDNEAFKYITHHV